MLGRRKFFKEFMRSLTRVILGLIAALSQSSESRGFPVVAADQQERWPEVSALAAAMTGSIAALLKRAGRGRLSGGGL